MSTQRVPLANNPNAVNSPYRGTLASKRARGDANDLDKDVSPPKKRQMLGKDAGPLHRAQRANVNDLEGRIFTERRSNTSQRSLFQQKLLAAQQARQAAEERHGRQQAAPNKDSKDQLDSWRRHYCRVFPDFVIYLDSVPSDVTLYLKRCVHKLGGRQADFFSKDVTHVITTRPIPTTSSEGSAKDRKATVDPSDISKTLGRPQLRGQQRSGTMTQDLAPKGPTDTRNSATNDILHKAQGLGIKIWALEKFERMLNVILHPEPADDDDVPSRTRTATTTGKTLPLKRAREADLTQLLRNERNNAPVERKPWQEIIPFKGPYIYIHDMDEKVKPVMVREYAAPSRKEEGEWPMLRSVSKGRCPFIEEPPQEKRPESRRQAPKGEKAAPIAPRPTRANAVPTPTETQPERRRTRSTTRSPQKPVLAETSTNQISQPSVPTAKSFEPPAVVRRHHSGSTETMPPLLGSTHANFKGIPRNPGGEPLASGMQKDVTSAIRSQMYSSTAPAAPSARVGMSKQQHQMSRRVLERQSGLSANSTNSMPSSLSVNEVRAAINNEHGSAPRRSARQKAAEPLAQIHEDAETEHDAQVPRPKVVGTKKKAVVKREPKPGYCENCRDKYDDFTEHIVSKKHRKFATTDDNWTELDQLLEKLIRV